MIPQTYPLYARIWTTDNPTDINTAAIIGWNYHPAGFTPVIAPLHSDHGEEIAFNPETGGEHGWRWIYTTNPDDTWTPDRQARSCDTISGRTP